MLCRIVRSSMALPFARDIVSKGSHERGQEGTSLNHSPSRSGANQRQQSKKKGCRPLRVLLQSLKHSPNRLRAYRSLRFEKRRHPVRMLLKGMTRTCHMQRFLWQHKVKISEDSLCMPVNSATKRLHGSERFANSLNRPARAAFACSFRFATPMFHRVSCSR